MKKADNEARDLWFYERTAREQGFTVIAGIDEVGRGPLAGPVVAACVVLPEDFDLTDIDDSKKLTEKRRERSDIRIRAEALAYQIAVVDSQTIDRINILQATRQAMRLALSGLPPEYVPDLVLVDGHPVPSLGCQNQQAIVSGDSMSASVAAASIIAKVARDRMMVAYDLEYPEYGFAGHKGYGAPKHLAALTAHGPCSIHRHSFSPVSAAARSKATYP